MLNSIALIILGGLASGWVCKKIKFPSLFGMIICGIVIGPHMLNLLDSGILDISAEIRRIALIIILIGAGLKLNMGDLKKVGRPAVLMCFLPACFEIGGMVALAPVIFGMSLIDSAILGAVVAAVSPAVIVPRMIRLIDEKFGTKESIPQMILAGASVDDVFVIVMFTAFVGIAKGESVAVWDFLNIPVSIVLGVIGGLAVGHLLCQFFDKRVKNDTIKTIVFFAVMLAVSCLDDNAFKIPFASLIAVMFAGVAVKRGKSEIAAKMSNQFDKLWTAAEIFLFVLVGTTVATESLCGAGINAVVLIVGALIFRMAGVYACLLKTSLCLKEKLFCMIAYTPKATVQAAIGGLPLAYGLGCGEIVLTVSVIAILLTAPFGAFGVDLTYKRFLRKEK